ncbi:unnamed protein product [Linum tenue]|uniref:GH16 domain-containing protein n=1 Tax=Linum tenue TaxID=586396 RepID=A0AAV0RS12_9ROSI|nr:unnamed protein product [Linum tenue]
MGFLSRTSSVLVVIISCCLVGVALAGNFYEEFSLTWGGPRAQISNGGRQLSLSLDNTSGSGFESKKEYLFGKIDMQLKLVSGNSAGTVTAYYVRIYILVGILTIKSLNLLAFRMFFFFN